MSEKQHEDRPRTNEPADLADDAINDAIGAVQGSPPPDGSEVTEQDGSSAAPETSSDQLPPDAGEIEWAGQVVKRPPSSEA